MKKSRVFFVLAVFVLIAVLAGTAEAAAQYVQSFELYRENSKKGTPIRRNETIALKPGGIILYVNPISDYTGLQDFDSLLEIPTLGIAEELKSQSNVNFYYNFKDPFSGLGELLVNTDSFLENAITVYIQLVTHVKYSTGDGTTKEVDLLSERFPLRLGYDDDNGGGSCSVLGAGMMAFLLIPLTVFCVKRGKAQGRSLQ